MFRGLLLTSLFIIFNLQAAVGQSNKHHTIDSLQQVIAQPSHDTLKVKALNELAATLRSHDLDSAIKLSQQALQLAQDLQWTKGKGSTHNTLGSLQSLKGEYSKSLTHYRQALDVWEQQGNTKEKAATTGNMGIVYYERGNYSKALDYYFKALKESKKINDKALMASWLSGIGIIYKNQGNYPKALDYYFKALKIKRQLNNKKSVAVTLGNIGIVYYDQGDYPKALKYYTKALKIHQKLGSKRGVGRHLGNMALIYKKQGNYIKALNHYLKALKKNKAIGMKRQVAINLSNIGNLYTTVYEKPDSIRRRVLQATFPRLSMESLAPSISKPTASLMLDTALTLQRKALKINKEIGATDNIAYNYANLGRILQAKAKYQGALHYYNKSYRIADSLGALSLQKTAAQRLYEVYKTLGKPSPSLKWHERFTRLKDSLFNKQKQKALGKLETRHKWQKKQMKDSLQHAKEMRAQKLKHQHEIQQQRYILYSAAGGLILVLVFSGILYNRFRVTQQQRDMIEQQNEEITSSISYAKQIQQALLTTESKEISYLPPHFVLFKPHSIVSGDFYWSVRKGNYWYIAAADCTGHGVPGALLTMLGTAFLNEITAAEEAIEPGPLLDQLRERFVKELKEDQTDKDKFRMRDGMDISLSRINLKTLKISWSGANNPLYIIRPKEEREINANYKHHMKRKGNVLYELSPQYQHIGYVQHPEAFPTYQVQLQENDTLYMFSDGFPDQFGGPRGKKFKKKRFKRTLLDIQDKDIKSQKEYLNKTIEHWMAQNDEEQIDDICVVGIKLITS